MVPYVCRFKGIVPLTCEFLQLSTLRQGIKKSLAQQRAARETYPVRGGQNKGAGAQNTCSSTTFLQAAACDEVIVTWRISASATRGEHHSYRTIPPSCLSNDQRKP